MGRERRPPYKRSRFAPFAGQTQQIEARLQIDQDIITSPPTTTQHVLDSAYVDQWRGGNRAGWPVIGYGTARLLPEPKTSAEPTSPALERLQSLFGSPALISTNFIDHLLTREAARTHGAAYLKLLEQVLQRVISRFQRLEQRGHAGISSSERLMGPRFVLGDDRASSLKLPATWLSQGEQATISWLADLIGWLYWETPAGETLDLQTARAIVLIDELDLHLHPTWQRMLIGTLKALMPQVQFIVTTHSPMLLPGLEPDEIVRLDLSPSGDVIAQRGDPAPKAMTGSQLYQSFFDIDHARDDALDQKLMRYSFLISDPGRSSADELELQQLQLDLQREGVDPGWHVLPRDASLTAPETER